MRFQNLSFTIGVFLALVFAPTVFAQEKGASTQKAAVENEQAASAPASTQPSSATPATPAPVKTPAGLGFADHLFLDGDWYRAISEYRRFLFEVKGAHPEAPRAALAIGEALLRGEQYEAAGRQLDGVAKRTGDPLLKGTALFGAARAYLLHDLPEYAKPRFRLITQDETLPASLRQEAKWLLAWGHFDSGEFDAAYRLFDELAKGEGKYKSAAQGASKSLLAEEEIPQKDPLIAALLSLVPGGGHFYLGRYGTGLTSLVWNGIFIAAAAHAWLSGDFGVALVLTVFELGWYSGGVFGAMSGAYKYNRDAYRNWRDQTIAEFGVNRELPGMHRFNDQKAMPGSLIRFGGTF